MKHQPRLKVSARRRRSQSGLEAIEFGLWVLLMMPALVWTFISGMNFVRYVKASDVTRAAAMLYTKGSDMSEVGLQQVLERVANGLDLQVDNNGVRVNNLGSGLIVLTRVEYVGSTCGCTNASKYVMTQRLYIGNRSLTISGSTVESFSGAAPSTGWNSTSGSVSNFKNNATAVVSTGFSTLWGSSLSDGQYVYVIETFFKPTTPMGTGQFDANGVYNRIFM
jgi:Flp pilus assembly protein TadG